MSDPEDVMLEQLRALSRRVDPPPAAVTEAARAAFTWRTVDRELAELVYDSDVEERPLAGVRGGTGPRMLTFEGPTLTVECQVTTVGDMRSLAGQVVPPAATPVELRRADGTTVRVETDALGRFFVDALAPGPMSLRCPPGRDRTAVETGWLTI